MKYRVKITEGLEKKLKRIPKRDKAHIIDKIDSLANDPRPSDCKKLKGNQKPPLYRIRAGDYRIIYTIQDDILLVLLVDVGHRKDIYQ